METIKGDRTGWDQFVAPVMFFLSLEFLALVAAILVLWIDVDRVVDPSHLTDAATLGDLTALELSEREIEFENAAHGWGNLCAIVLLLLWPIFIAEQIVNFVRLEEGESYREKYPFGWLFCVCPPLRLCAHRRGEVEEVWLPKLGWKPTNRKLQKYLERVFSIPMIWIALMILPVLAIHFVFKEGIVEYPLLRMLLHFGTGMIWFAFTVEFIVMVSVAENKLKYCKKHWLDLAIILLPLISFLRSLRILRAGKILKAGKLTQLAKLVRAYRLRGVAMRGFRALMVLEVVSRLLKIKPERRIRKLEELRAEKLRELEELDEEIEELRKMQADGDSAVKDSAANEESSADAANSMDLKPHFQTSSDPHTATESVD